MKTLVFHMTNDENRDLSYQHGWIKAFKKDKRFLLTEVNLSEYFSVYKKIINFYKIKNILFEKFDLIIFLHSSFSNALYIPNYLIDIVRYKKAYKVFFIGNEYKLMPEKINFCKKINLNLLVTQSLNDRIIKLYNQKINCDVIGIPGSGLDKEIYHPNKNFDNRFIDIGLRTYDEPIYFGHQERRQLMNKTQEAAKKENLQIDLSMEKKDRFIGSDWAKFLNNCKSIIGTNTGFDYFALDDHIRNDVNRLEIKYNGNFSKIYDEYFTKINPKESMRIISGKNIEAAGCKTLQILTEGDYGGYFLPNIHYISINKDLSNLNECLSLIKNKNFCKKIIENSYQTVLNKLTYENHINKLLKHVSKKI